MAGRTIEFVTSDERIFIVDLNVAKISEVIRTILEDVEEPNEEGPIPLGILNGDTFEIVLDWMQHEHNVQLFAAGANANIELDENFWNLDLERLNAIAKAACFLNIENLENAACQQIANRMMQQLPDILLPKIANFWLP